MVEPVPNSLVRESDVPRVVGIVDFAADRGLVSCEIFGPDRRLRTGRPQRSRAPANTRTVVRPVRFPRSTGSIMVRCEMAPASSQAGSSSIPSSLRWGVSSAARRRHGAPSCASVSCAGNPRRRARDNTNGASWRASAWTPLAATVTRRGSSRPQPPHFLCRMEAVSGPHSPPPPLPPLPRLPRLRYPGCRGGSANRPDRTEPP